MNINFFNPTKRFSSNVKNYANCRPSYPIEMIEFLNSEIDLKNKVVADVGAGTGKLTKLFLENGNYVFVIEPNNNMLKEACNQLVEHNKYVKFLNSTAEKIDLPDSSVNVIAAAQAFHWFNTEECIKEFYRIIKEDGYILLIWNVMKENEFSEDYKKLYINYSMEFNNINHNIDEEAIEKGFKPNKISKQTFYNYQILNHESFIARICSSSFSPKATEESYEMFISDASEIFYKHQIDGKVKIEYDSVLYYSIIKKI